MSVKAVVAAPRQRELTYPTKTQKGAYKGCTLQAGTYSRHKTSSLNLRGDVLILKFTNGK